MINGEGVVTTERFRRGSTRSLMILGGSRIYENRIETMHTD